MLSPDYVKSVNEWVQWYNYHYKSWDNMALENRVKFQQKAIHGLFNLIAGTADEVHRIDAGERVKDPNQPKLLLPVGVRIG